MRLVAGFIRLQSSVYIFSRMLKKCSLSTDHGGEHSILSKIGNYAAISFPPFKGIVVQVEVSKICPAYFSESVLIMISEHFYFLKFFFF